VNNFRIKAMIGGIDAKRVIGGNPPLAFHFYGLNQLADPKTVTCRVPKSKPSHPRLDWTNLHSYHPSVFAMLLIEVRPPSNIKERAVIPDSIEASPMRFNLL
jgi:hypothetical protein